MSRSLRGGVCRRRPLFDWMWICQLNADLSTMRDRKTRKESGNTANRRIVSATQRNAGPAPPPFFGVLTGARARSIIDSENNCHSDGKRRKRKKLGGRRTKREEYGTGRRAKQQEGAPAARPETPLATRNTHRGRTRHTASAPGIPRPYSAHSRRAARAFCGDTALRPHDGAVTGGHRLSQRGLRRQL